MIVKIHIYTTDEDVDNNSLREEVLYQEHLFEDKHYTLKKFDDIVPKIKDIIENETI